jgi:hypothetical protein
VDLSGEVGLIDDHHPLKTELFVGRRLMIAVWSIPSIDSSHFF